MPLRRERSILLSAASWRLVLIVGLPFWASAGAVRTFTLALGPGADGASTTIAVVLAQHALVTTIALLLYLLSLAVGWPRGRRLSAALQHAVLLLVFAACVPPILLAAESATRLRVATALDYVVTYALGLALILGVRAMIALRELDLERAALHASTMQSHLYALRMQMNPHFAFNTLNSIAALLDRDPPRARALLMSMSGLYRRTLDASRADWHTLGQEFDIAHEYLSIQSERADGGLQFELSADDETRRCAVPALLLQPLIENAVLHGIAEDAQSLRIWVHAWRAADRASGMRLLVEVGNSSRALAPGGAGRGLGLANTTQRLATAFSGAATIDCARPDVGTFVVTLALPVMP